MVLPCYCTTRNIKNASRWFWTRPNLLLWVQRKLRIEKKQWPKSFFFTGWEFTGSQQVILVHCATVVVAGLWFGKHYELNHMAAQCDTSNRHTSPLQTTSLMHPSTTSCNSLKIAVINFGHIPERHVTASGWGGGWWVANVWVWISKGLEWNLHW